MAKGVIVSAGGSKGKSVKRTVLLRGRPKVKRERIALRIGAMPAGAFVARQAWIECGEAFPGPDISLTPT
jgi:hypothetical protein